MLGQAWWYTPVVPAHGRPSQQDYCEPWPAYIVIAQPVWATVNPVSKGKRGELFSNLIFQCSQNSTAMKLEESTTSIECQWAVYLEVGPWLRVWKNWRIPRTGQTSWINWLLQKQAGYLKGRDAFSFATRYTFSWVFCAIQTLSSIMKKSVWISLDLVEHVCQKTICKGPETHWERLKCEGQLYMHFSELGVEVRKIKPIICKSEGWKAFKRASRAGKRHWWLTQSRNKFLDFRGRCLGGLLSGRVTLCH